MEGKSKIIAAIIASIVIGVKDITKRIIEINFALIVAANLKQNLAIEVYVAKSAKRKQQGKKLKSESKNNVQK